MAYQRAAQLITHEEYGTKPEYMYVTSEHQGITCGVTAFFFSFLMKRIGNVQNELGVLYMNTQRESKAGALLSI